MHLVSIKSADSRLDLELHFVHKNDDGQLAVIGVMMNEKSGQENKNLKAMWEHLPGLKKQKLMKLQWWTLPHFFQSIAISTIMLEA